MPNNNYQVRLLSIAEEDLTEIIIYIAMENPTAANRIADKIEKNMLLLYKNPHLGRIPRDEEIKELGYRYLIVENYIIFYTIEKNIIWIHRILHSSRDYKLFL